MSEQIVTPFAIYDANNKIAHVGLYSNEDDCWRVYLGWPTRGEVRDAKERGLRVAPVMVSESRKPVRRKIAP